MTQEDKELLLKDLCARLPYGVKIQLRNTYNYHHENICKQGDFTIDEIKSIDKKGEYIKIYHNNPLDWEWYVDDIEIEDIKPYLRPMSSMTEEECKILGNISATLENNLIEVLPNIPYYIEVAVPDQIDWLNAHHFDYRGLIEKGLALEAPKRMYEIQN